MMLASPTQYGTLPSMPHVNALPQGIPQGPWGPLYRSAPGAQIPAVRYPGMRGGLGAAPVQLVGGGLGASEGFTLTFALLNVLTAAGVGAALAYSASAKRPALTGALTLGGVAFASSMMTWLATKA